MASQSNPNTLSKNKRIERAKKSAKTRAKAAYSQKLERKHGITKAQARKGARPGLLPTSGPGAPISKKKQRKLERNLGYAMKRRMEAEGEVVMKGSWPPRLELERDARGEGGL
jgi:hypothetical protein